MNWNLFVGDFMEGLSDLLILKAKWICVSRFAVWSRTRVNFTFSKGAGIVYDSSPEAEAEETTIKARAVLNAISLARALSERRKG